MPGADYTQDAGFMAAPKSEQFAYLSHVDPDFAKASPADQQAYVNHITKAPGAPESTPAAQTPASAWQRMGEGALSGLEAMNPYKGVSSPSDFLKREGQIVAVPFAGLPGIAANAISTYQKERRSGQGIIPSIGSAVGGQTGLDTEGIKQRAQQGNVAGVVGEGIPAIAATLLGGEAGNLGDVMPSVESVKNITASPIRYAARTLEDAANAKLSPIKSIKGLMQPADQAVKMRVQIPGRDFGLSAPKAAPQMPVMSSEPFSLSQEEGPKIGENAAQLPIEFPAKPEVTPGEAYNATPKRNLMNDLGKQIEQGAGWKPLEPNTPIGQQLPNLGGKPTFRRAPLMGRVEQLEEGAGLNVAPEKMPTIPQEEVGREMGAPPLQPNRPLREQFKPDAEAMAHQSEQSRLEQKYPDKAMRQMVHANGEAMVDAIGDDPETLRAIHDLRNPDIRQAVINSGEDMGQKNIGNRKAMGEGQMTRQDALGLLLKKGYTPQQIIEMAQPPEEVGAAKPGPQRMTGFKKEERQAGD